jgi:hypothetical protein
MSIPKTKGIIDKAAKPLYVIRIEVFEEDQYVRVIDVRCKADSKAIDILEKAKLSLISMQ